MRQKSHNFEMENCKRLWFICVYFFQMWTLNTIHGVYVVTGMASQSESCVFGLCLTRVLALPQYIHIWTWAHTQTQSNVATPSGWRCFPLLIVIHLSSRNVMYFVHDFLNRINESTLSHADFVRLSCCCK